MELNNSYIQFHYDLCDLLQYMLPVSFFFLVVQYEIKQTILLKNSLIFVRVNSN